MTHAAPSASEKEKTARLVASLSCKEQAELLAQALLREFMHRRGLHETLKAFDEENPRDERTISSRAVMRQLLNIPVEGRPSRLQPTMSAATGKAQPPTFMEELCSYRLTKRGYTHPALKIGDEKPDGEEDPSDTELRSLHERAEAHRTAKAACEQKQRRYEEMLAEEELYQRRKEAHMEKKKKKREKRRGSGGSSSKSQHKKHRQGGTSTSTSGSESEADGGSLAGVMQERFSHSLRLAPSAAAASKRRGSAEAAQSGAAWQPPGVASVGDVVGTPHQSGHCTPSHSSSWTPTAEVGEAADKDNSNSKNNNDDDDFDPFGSAASSQQALMARVRAESRHWASNSSGDTSIHSTPNRGSGGVGAVGTGVGEPVTPAALSNVLRGVPLDHGDEPPLRLGGLGPASGVGGAALGGGLSALSALGGNARLSAMAAGYNPNAVAVSEGGKPRTVTGPPLASLRPAHAGSREDGETEEGGPAGFTPYIHGFPPPPSSALAPSIMVKHTDPVRRDTTAALSPSPTFDLAGGSGGGGAAPVNGDDRAAMPRGSALAGSNSNSSGTVSPSNVGRAAASFAVEMRSPSPNTSAASGEDGASFHTPSRSANSSGGGGNNSGLRHGIGFRTSASAEATHSGTAAGEGEGVRPSRKERRVKLLIDE
ncbi:hypothetical protein NQL31_006449 [Lotmaria passim]